MLLLYADIGSYTPSFKKPTVQKPSKTAQYNKLSLSSLSGRESGVYLWGDGHTLPTELDKESIGFVAKVALGKLEIIFWNKYFQGPEHVPV